MTEQEQANASMAMPSLLEGEVNLDPEAANQAAKVVTKEEPNENKDGGGANNENSVMSFWSSSNSDSDDFNDANKTEAADPTSRRGRKGQGRQRRRRSPGSDKNNARSGSDERKEFENEGGRRGRRSRSRDNSPSNLDKQNGMAGTAGGDAEGGPSAGNQDGQNGHHNKRERSNDSRGSSQDRGGDRYDSRRRGMNSRKDIGAMGTGSERGGRGGSTYRGRGGKRDGGEYRPNGFFYPSMSKPLVSFQQFSSLQTRQSDLYSIKNQYKSYMGQHKDKHASAFWKDHEKEPWFMESYNPMTMYQIKSEAQELTQAKAKAFFSSMPMNLLDLTRREDLPSLDGPQLHKYDPNSRTLYLKQIPTFVSRVQLKEAVSSMTKGLEQIIFSRPLQMHSFERFAWLVYATEEQAEAAIPDLDTLVIRAPADSQIEDFKLSPIKNNQTVKQPKVTPQLAEDHVARDIDLCKRLVKEVFDAEKLIEFPFERLETDVQSADAKLDTLVLYLRQVYGYCFFCGVKCEDERALAGKCASQHLRMPPTVERVVFDTSALYGSAKLFEQNYVQSAEKLLEKGSDEKLQDPQEDELLVEMKNQYCLDKTKEVLEGKKYVCKVCEKAFRSTEFVVKHIQNKHLDRLVRQNYSYFKQQARENFLNELKKTQDAQQLLHSQSSFASTRGDNPMGGSGLSREPSGNFNNSNYEDRGSQRGGYSRGGRGGNDGGSDGYQGRGGRGGYFNNRGGGDRGNYGDKPRFGNNGSGSFMGNNGANGEDGEMEDGEKRNNKAQAPQREYVDYDDPTQFDREGQRITGQTAVVAQNNHQLQLQQQQQLLLKQQHNAANAVAAAGGSSLQQERDRQIVSYDDLF